MRYDFARFFVPAFSPEGDGGSGTPNPTDSGGRLDPVRLIAENGTADAAVRALAFKLNDVERDNAGLREKVREIKALVPVDGARVLSPEQVATFDAFTAELASAGLDTSEKLRAHLATAQADAARVAEAARTAELSRVAEAAGANPAALAAVFTQGETFEVEGEGADAKVYVKPRAKDGEAAPQRVELDAYIDADDARKALRPALFTEQAATPPVGTRFVDQPAAGRPATPGKPDPAAIAEQKRRSGDYEMI